MEIIVSLTSLIFFIACCVTIARIGEIRDETKRQTKLLQQLVSQTRKDEPAKIDSIYKEAKIAAKAASGIPIALIILIVTIIVLAAIAMATRN